jgi:hypothetical protein
MILERLRLAAFEGDPPDRRSITQSMGGEQYPFSILRTRAIKIIVECSQLLGMTAVGIKPPDARTSDTVSK